MKLINVKSIIETQSKYEFDVYPKREIAIVRGKNSLLFDADGNEYIDCAAGIGVANIGHANEFVNQAIQKQLEKISVVPGIFYNDAKAGFLKKLIGIISPNLTSAFLTNSGTESIEAALKFARITTGKTNFVCAMKSFHGRTMGSLSATFKKEYRQDFAPLVPGFAFAPLNKLEKFVEKIDENTAAVLIELIQGEGGINISNINFIKELYNYCKKNEILFIVDEIQTGFGRTGKMFAYEHYEIEPDILCLAKGIANGFPMGAVVCSGKIIVPKGKHGSTFGGNPLACAAGTATIEFMLKNDISKLAEIKGKYLRKKLGLIKSEKIRNIRGIGLMTGIELKERVKPYLEKLLELGIIALPAGKTVLRLLPPLTISYEELDEVCDRIEVVLNCC